MKQTNTITSEFKALQTDRLVLRAPLMSDTQTLLDLISNPEIYQWTATNGASITYEKEQAHVAKIIEKQTKPTSDFFWVVDIDSNAVGTVSFHINHSSNPHRAILGYMLSPDYWGKGLITEAVKKVVDFAFTIDRITSLQIDALAPNIGSHRVALKCGFAKDGILRDWYLKDGVMFDVHTFSLLKSEYIS